MFMAYGPSFKLGYKSPPFLNIELYNLMTGMIEFVWLNCQLATKNSLRQKSVIESYLSYTKKFWSLIHQSIMSTRVGPLHKSAMAMGATSLKSLGTTGLEECESHSSCATTDMTMTLTVVPQIFWGFPPRRITERKAVSTTCSNTRPGYVNVLPVTSTTRVHFQPMTIFITNGPIRRSVSAAYPK